MTWFLRVDFHESSNGESNRDVTRCGATQCTVGKASVYMMEVELQLWEGLLQGSCCDFFSSLTCIFMHYWHSETVEEQFTVEHSYLMLYLNSTLPRAPVLQEIFIFWIRKIKEWLFWPFQMRQTQRRRGSNTAWMYRTRVCSARRNHGKSLSFWWGSSQLLLTSCASRLFYFIWSLAHLQVNACIYI